MQDMAANPPNNPRSSSKLNIEYTDVVVIGNGPSGICLSYLLSGNVPYYTGEPHPNEYLQLRLQDDIDKSILEQDLDYLSSGLEGRSANPVAVLFDALTHPDADMGMETASMLTWKHSKERLIPHVVLGKNRVGGAWQMMEGSMQTLSLGNWMQLPGLPIKEWLHKRRAALSGDELDVASTGNRVGIQDIKKYYEDYVQEKNIGEKFLEGATVTSVERVLDVCHSIDMESGEQNPCSRDHCGKVKWEVRGVVTQPGDDGEAVVEDFCYRAPSVVLATGSFDQPNRLWVPGDHYPCVKHSFNDLEELLMRGEVGPESDPVMVVGAGLTAADAIMLAQAHDIPVVHVFRRDYNDSNIMLRKLPKLLYPEYHRVLQMMTGEEEVEHYTPYPMHNITEVMQDGKVLIRPEDNTGDTIISTSHILVLIGSRPDLSFLPHEGRNLGVVPDMHIDCKHNPVDIDPYTYQSNHECGLYAMGPLVGDNFVRFLRGGALGITSHLWHKRDQAAM